MLLKKFWKIKMENPGSVIRWWSLFAFLVFCNPIHNYQPFAREIIDPEVINYVNPSGNISWSVKEQWVRFDCTTDSYFLLDARVYYGVGQFYWWQITKEVKSGDYIMIKLKEKTNLSSIYVMIITYNTLTYQRTAIISFQY